MISDCSYVALITFKADKYKIFGNAFLCKPIRPDKLYIHEDGFKLEIIVISNDGVQIDVRYKKWYIWISKSKHLMHAIYTNTKSIMLV